MFRTKIKHLKFVSGFLLSIMMTNGVSGQISPADILLNFPLDHSTKDHSKNNQKLETSLTFYGSDRKGQDSLALNFDGKKSFASMKNRGELNLASGDFTFSFYFFLRSDLLKSPMYLFQKLAQANAKGWSIGLQDEGVCKFFFKVNSGKQGTITSEKNILPEQWYHVAISYNSINQTAYLYIDGELDAEVPAFPQPSELNTAALFVGKSSYSNEVFFNGKLDDWLIIKQYMDEASVKKYLNHQSSENNELYENISDLKKGLVAHYQLNRSAKDESGNENHGKVFNASFCEDRFGNLNSALKLDGDSDYVLIKSSPTINIFEKQSISFWFSTPGTYPFSGIISKMIYHDDQMQGYKVGINNKSMFYCNYGLLGEKSHQQAADLFVADNQWHHFAMVYDGRTVKMFMDANNISLAYYKSGIGASPAPLILGWDNCCKQPRFFSGKLDNVRIYNRDLTEMEILEMYNEDAESIEEMMEEIIKGKLEQWAMKGKFEKTSEHQLRVNDSTRSIQHEVFFNVVSDSLAQANFANAIPTNEYDADREVFIINYPGFYPIELSVPLKEAPEFDQNFFKLEYSNLRFSYAKNNFVIEKLFAKNPLNGKKYSYNRLKK